MFSLLIVNFYAIKGTEQGYLGEELTYHSQEPYYGRYNHQGSIPVLQQYDIVFEMPINSYDSQPVISTIQSIVPNDIMGNAHISQLDNSQKTHAVEPVINTNTLPISHEKLFQQEYRHAEHDAKPKTQQPSLIDFNSTLNIESQRFSQSHSHTNSGVPSAATSLSTSENVLPSADIIYVADKPTSDFVSTGTSQRPIDPTYSTMPEVFIPQQRNQTFAPLKQPDYNEQNPLIQEDIVILPVNKQAEVTPTPTKETDSTEKKNSDSNKKENASKKDSSSTREKSASKDTENGIKECTVLVSLMFMILVCNL
ncbi:hypothetical protein H312_03000 [Anncaliia algerae PRA339]|uniref:Uncharacterized protein n=1 Tax=Anncaliia algerae PRA339 TaxID=1288291 RepID=A0A059EXH6_9MICR|nr:hypothetical protein H312_03000 [Anncaliia algerae PRA339]